jgi:hypothetical protein
MQQKAVLANALMIGALLYGPCALAQTSGNSGSGPASTGSRTTGLASGQAHISPPGTNSLGTANSGGETVGANMEPNENRNFDSEIQNENSRINSKLKGICRGC